MTQLSKLSAAENIKLVKDIARKLYPNSDQKLLADLTVTQAILEGGLRKAPPSSLALKYCNLFGQKPGYIKKGTAGIVYLMTKEFVKGKEISIQQPFLANKNIEDSFEQHMKLLTELPRYQNLKQAENFEDIARRIQVSGYATDPKYSKLLIEIYEEYIK